MRVTVNYEDTDVAKALSKIIKDSNAEEFVKLLLYYVIVVMVLSTSSSL